MRYGANTPLANLLPAPSLFIPGGSQLEVSSWRVSSHFLCQLHIAACCPLLIITEGLMQNCSETGFGPLLRCINALPTQYSINQREFQSDIGGNFFWVNI